MMSETFLLWFIKSWAVLFSRWARGWGICLLFWSQPGAFDGLVYPHPREFAIFKKKNANARGGWALLELTDALQLNCLSDVPIDDVCRPAV